MKPCRHYPIFMLGYLFSISDAAVTITTTDSLNSAAYLECNSAVTLTCTTPANPLSLIWRVDGVTESDCLLGTCTSYPSYPGNYLFTDDLSTGTFTLKMDPLIFTDNGKLIQCADESNSDTFTPDVKVLADSASTTITNTTDSFGTNLTVATGCVFPPGSITFTWKYFKSGETAQPYNTSSPSAKTADATGCSTGDCGGTGVEKVSQTLTIEEDSSGEAYFFQVVVNHADATGHDITVTTTGTYKLAAGKDSCECTVCAIILLILVIIEAAAIIVIACLLYNAKTDGDGLAIVGGIAAVGIIVNIIVCVVTKEPTCSLSICAILGIVIGPIDVLASIAIIVYVIIKKQGDTAKGPLELKSGNGRTEDSSADKRP